jgi:hypothetical protein
MPAMAAFGIIKMVISMNDETVGSIDSSSPGQSHENR